MTPRHQTQAVPGPSSPPARRHQHRARRVVSAPAAFTLAEVTIAVGIAATVMMALLAILPLGLDNLRRSAARMADARIIQAVAADYQMRDWSKVKPADETPILLAFDDRGTEVSHGSREHIYTAQVVLADDAPVLSGDTSGNPFLRRLRVRITDRGDMADSFAIPAFYREHHVMVANIEK